MPGKQFGTTRHRDRRGRHHSQQHRQRKTAPHESQKAKTGRPSTHYMKRRKTKAAVVLACVWAHQDLPRKCHHSLEKTEVHICPHLHFEAIQFTKPGDLLTSKCPQHTKPPTLSSRNFLPDFSRISASNWQTRSDLPLDQLRVSAKFES